MATSFGLADRFRKLLGGAPNPEAAPVSPDQAPAQAPDPYQDHAAIKELVGRRMAEWTRGREAITRPAFRNILFFRGHQWIVFDRQQGRWRPTRLRRNTPTPVTNLFAATMRALIAVFARVEPTLNFRPATDEPEDKATADVSRRAIEVVEDEVSIRTLRQRLATWVGLTGGAWIETGYDPDPLHGMTLLQHEQCPTCGVVQPPGPGACQACGGPTEPAVDPSGQPVGHDVPVGKLYADVVPCFEMFFDPATPEWGKVRELCRQKSYTLDEAERRWPQLKGQIAPDSLSSTGELYGETLPTIGPNLDDTQVTRQASSAGFRHQSPNNRVTEQWFSALPTETYPDGLLAILVGKTQVAYAGPLRYRDGSGKPFLNYVFFPQQLVPGTLWAKTVADDLAHKQTQHNRFESLVEQILMRTANPVWLVPEGTLLSPLTGEAGQLVRYNGLGPSPAKPERIAGQAVPSGLLNFLVKIEKDFEQLAGTFDVIKGARPEGVTAGIALQILQERGLSQFGPLFILWEAAWAEWARQALEIFREFATEERLLRIKGRDGGWQVQKFVGADLQGRIDVHPEAASSMPRSSLVDRAEMEQLVALRIINPTDPDTRLKFLEVYGRTNLTPAMALDTKNALMENEAFDALGATPQMAQLSPQFLATIKMLPFDQVVSMFTQAGLKIPRVRPAVDDHGLHAREHGLWLKSEHSQALPIAAQLLAEAHKAMHDQLHAKQLQSMMVAQQNGLGASGKGSGLLAGPGPSPMAGQGGRSPMNAGSGPARLQGEQDEMASRMTG